MHKRGGERTLSGKSKTVIKDVTRSSAIIKSRILFCWLYGYRQFSIATQGKTRAMVMLGA